MDAVTFCKYRDRGGDGNWACGCQAPEGKEGCRPAKLPAGASPLLDCFPGVDCSDRERRGMRGALEKSQKRPGFDR